MAKQHIVGGRVLEPPSSEWAALRTLAAGWRDSLPSSSPSHAHVLSLISLLDSYDNLRRDYPIAAAHLWTSARLLANKLSMTIR